MELLRTATLETLQQRTAAAYGGARRLTYPLGYHQAIHLAMHCGQIRTIRNLYCKMRGEPARFHPENPTYPNQPWTIVHGRHGVGNTGGFAMQLGAA